MAAASLLQSPTPALILRPPPISKSFASPISCGPRDNRGPLIRGRTLSTEAILAIQALKRSRNDDAKLDQIASKSLSRLLKSDLLAALAELQRQNQWLLALKVFAFARREPWYKVDHALYAEMASALARSGMAEKIDSLVPILMEEEEMRGGPSSEDVRGLARLVKALVAAGRGEAVREVYGMMKRGGCVPDEFLFGILIRGLWRLGEEEAAREVERDFEKWEGGGVGSEPVLVR